MLRRMSPAFATTAAVALLATAGFALAQARNGAGTAEPAAGSDLRYDLRITFEEAVHGTEKEIEFPVLARCDTCHGSGARAGTQPVTCGQCNGRGQIIRRPCKECRGEGYLRRERKLKVNIPAGVEDGTRIRLSGEGEAGTRGGPAGDLYVFLSVRRHQLFELEGADVHCRVPISMVQATLGGSIEVPTLDGKGLAVAPITALINRQPDS